MVYQDKKINTIKQETNLKIIEKQKFYHDVIVIQVQYDLYGIQITSTGIFLYIMSYD